MSVLEFGKAAIRLSLLSDDIEKQLNSFQAKLEKFGKKLLSVGKSFTIVGGAIVAPFAAGLKQFTSFGDELDKMSKRTGFSVQALQGLGVAAEQNGSSLESVGSAAQTMGTLLLMAGRGSKKATATLGDLGLSLQDLQGLTGPERMIAFAEAISKISDPLRQAALAEKVFGGAGVEMLPLLKQGAKGFEELLKHSQLLGPVLSGADTEAAATFHEKLNDLWTSVTRLSMQLGAAIVGPMTSFVNFVQPIVATIGGWIQQNRGLAFSIAAIGGVLLGIGTVLLVTGTIILYVGKAIDVCKIAVNGVKSAINFLSVAMAFLAANPVVAVLIAITALILIVLYATGVLGKLFHWFGKLVGVTDSATDSTNGLNDALNGIKTPDIDFDKLKSGLNINTDSMAGKGLDDAKQSLTFFDLSLAHQQLGDSNIPQQQLAELKQINKNLERQPKDFKVL